MSWTKIFPVLDDEMLEVFEDEVTAEESAGFEHWFGVAEKRRDARFQGSSVPFQAADTRGPAAPGTKAPHTSHPLRPFQSQPAYGGPHPPHPLDAWGPALGTHAFAARRHVVSATLFWKHVNEGDPELPVPTREMLVDARRMGLVKRFAPWESYIAPLFLHTPGAVARHPGVEFRLHLASDLGFLADDLCALGWTVYLMKSPSIRYCPGGFWRFWPLEEEGSLVTVIDTDRMGEVSGEIARTEAMAAMGLGLWRVPGYYNSDLSKQVRYRPILGGHFGAAGGIPVRRLVECFVWHWRRGTLPNTAQVPGVGERPIQSATWPNYGFDEWFLLAGLYPRLAPAGTITLIPSDARSLLLPADIEYATWANPRSECVYF